MESLRDGYLEVWAAGQNVPLARFADRASSIVSTGLDLVGISEPSRPLVAKLREFDSIVSWYGANRPEFRDAVSALGLPFHFLNALPPEAAGQHATDFYLDQVRPLAARPSEGIPRIPFDVQREEYAVIHPFSGSPKKNWPLPRFRQLAARLQQSMPVRWCAGPEDPPLEDAVRIDDLYELGTWLAKARLYIGNDSGITHLAAAAGTPVLALFGPTDPDVWAPRGANVRVAVWSRLSDTM